MARNNKNPSLKEDANTAASRYDGIAVGPRLEYTFEAQPGIPVDGSNKALRWTSPFTLRLVPPDPLLDLVERLGNQGSGISAVDAVTAAAQSSAVDAVGARTTQRPPSIVEGGVRNASYIAEGRVFSESSKHRVTLADQVVAADVLYQLRKIMEAPPLTLLVNPREMSISYTNIQTYATRTRYGFEFERWGEEQPTISFSGSTGAFIAGAADAPGTDVFAALSRGETPVVTGVQFASKRDSAAWQNLTSLLHFYKSNGYIYDTVGRTEAHQFVGAVAIDYDQWTYIGHIESFEYTYDQGKPHNVDWSMEFIVDRMLDNSTSTVAVRPLTAPTPSPGDPRYSRTGGTPVRAWGQDIAGQFKGFGKGVVEQTVEISLLGTVPFDLLE